MTEAARATLDELFPQRAARMHSQVLAIRDLEVRFGGVSALAGIGLDLADDELVAVIGPNGAGKSTLLNAICGVVRGNARGSIELLGQQILGRPAYVVADLGVGRSFQDPPLIDTETVLENVMVGAHLRLRYSMFDQVFLRRKVRRYEDEARRRALTALDLAGLTRHVDDLVAGLPYGTRKLIDIARSLMSGPALLLLDEPTSGLDSDEQARVKQMLLEIKSSQRVTVLVVEHHMELVRAVADKVVGLQAGTVLAVGSPNEVLDSANFRAALVGAGQPADAKAVPPENTTAST
jgi:ABC-type branched-subunit amino acid transport system ATPase component